MFSFLLGSSLLKQSHRALSVIGANADDGALPGSHGRQLLHRLAQDAGTGSTKWMAERHAAAVRVHALAREGAERTCHAGLVADEFRALQRLDVGENLRRESLVNFPQVNVGIGQRIAL